MNKTPKAKSKSKSKAKPPTKSTHRIPKHQKVQSNREKELLLTGGGSPRTMNYSKVMKKYGDMMDDSTNSLSKAKNEVILHKRKVSYDIESNDKSFTSFKSTLSKQNSIRIPSFNNKKSPLLKEDSSPIKSHHLKDKLNNSQDSESSNSQKSQSPSSSQKTRGTSTVSGINPTTDGKLTEKVGIMLKLFYKYSYKLFQLINSCNDINDLSTEIYEELKLTVNRLHSTVTNDKLYLMFSLKRNVTSIEEEKNTTALTMLDLTANQPESESLSKAHKLLIDNYEAQLKKLKEHNAKLRQAITSFEQKESETLKHFKEKCERAIKENRDLIAENDELKAARQSLHEKVNSLIENEGICKRQKDDIARLQSQIASLKTEVKFKEFTIGYLEKNLLRFKVNPNQSNSVNIKNYSQYEEAAQQSNVEKGFNDQTSVNNKAINPEDSSCVNYKDIKLSVGEGSMMINGSKNSTTQRTVQLNQFNSHNNVTTSDDLEPYLTNKLIKQLDNTSLGLSSQESHHLLSHTQMDKSPKKPHDALHEEIDVLDKEISSLKGRLKSMISTSKKSK